MRIWWKSSISVRKPNFFKYMLSEKLLRVAIKMVEFLSESVNFS